jgi:hypothetical protein
VLLLGTVDGEWLGSAVPLVVAVADAVVVPGVGWGDGPVQAANSTTSGTTIGNSLRIVTSTSIVRGCVGAVKTLEPANARPKKCPASKSH